MPAAFEMTEYRDRVQQVSAAMEARGIDTLVLLSEANINYLSGYEGMSDYVPQVAILRAGDTDASLVLREMDIHCAYPTVYLEAERVDCYPERYIGTAAHSPWEVIADRVKAIAGDGRIGVEFGANCFSFKDHQNFVAALGERSLVDGTGVTEVAKRRKSPAELAYMRQAGVIVDQALQAGIAEIAEGVRECDVAATITRHLISGTPECGGGPSNKPVTMGAGHRVAAPHLKWTDARYTPGDQTDFEVGAYVHRYACPLSRTVYLGDPPPRLLEVHDAVLSGFLGGFEAVRPGATCGDVYRGFAKAFFPRGVRKESRIGYSLGIEWADGCFSLQDDDQTELDVDYTFHLIIGVWEHDDAYVFSEALRVGPQGAESLSKTPRKLFVQ